MLDQYEELETLATRYDDVVARIAREHRVSRSKARSWFVEMVRYLDLCHASETALTPSKKVDKAWHEFILFTREYEAFCQRRYGRFIHHDPYDKPAPDGYAKTYAAYVAAYGKPSKRLWPVPGGFGFTGGGSGCGGLFGGDGGGDSGGSCGGGGCGGGGS